MQNIEEILIKYVEARLQLSEVIIEKVKGDWSKLSILIENDEKAYKSFDTMLNSLNEFREATSVGKFFTYPKEFKKIYELLEKITLKPDPEFSVGFSLGEARDMIADLMSDGEEDRRAKALDQLAQLPNYSPDDWVRRKYLIQGIYLSQTNKVPPYLIPRIKEAYFSFIYGNFLASIALARAILEMALKDRFPVLKVKDLSFYDILNEKWFQIKGLKDDDEMQKMAEFIRTAGNQIMHNPQDKVIRIYNEFATTSVLRNLRSLIEFLYQ